MAPPAVREKLKEGGDRSIKHTDGEINVSIEIKCYYYRPKKWRMIPLKWLLGQICIFWGILAAARSIKTAGTTLESAMPGTPGPEVGFEEIIR